ncbi:MAG: hypothetical protein HQ581_10805, partial [Planctomycetes bacterium]|nr:hypothetical protein [Planctomycetota bacterium]
ESPEDKGGQAAHGTPAPGTIVKAADNRLRVACAEGAIELAELQPSGKRMMSVDEFLRGHPLGPGGRFGDEETKGPGPYLVL